MIEKRSLEVMESMLTTLLRGDSRKRGREDTDTTDDGDKGEGASKRLNVNN